MKINIRMDKYLNAITNYFNFKNKEWLIYYFDLYKTTLNWPKGLPPIHDCYLNNPEYRTKKIFNQLYERTLRSYEYEFKNSTRELIIINDKFKIN